MSGVGFLAFIPLVNSIYAVAITSLVTWVLILLIRKDLFLPSIGTAVLSTLLAFLAYKIVIQSHPGIVKAWWDLGNISGVLVSGIPLEEYLWFFTTGLVSGPMFELWRGIGFVKIKNNQ